MDFFKSLISDDPDPPQPHNPHDPEPDSQSPSDPDQSVDVNHHDADGGGGLWSFGGLIQTIATRSESVLETYRRDLQEFGTGLKKETDIFREVASKAVKDLPASIEIAHGAIDGVIKSTAEIISNGKESLLAPSDDVGGELETPDTNRIVSSGRYSRFEAQLNTIQNDANTYCEEPDDIEEFSKWKSGFPLIERGVEITNLIGENGALEGIYKRVVPNVVDNETFWFRYFYRVHKLQQQESLRANLVKRAISIDDEEELSWDFDDDEENEVEEESADVQQKGDESDNKDLGGQDTKRTAKEEGAGDESHASEEESAAVKQKGNELDRKDSVGQSMEVTEKEEDGKDASLNVSAGFVGENKSNAETAGKQDTLELSGNSTSPSSSKDISEVHVGGNVVKLEESSEMKKNEKVDISEGKIDQGETDVSVVLSQQSAPEEEDIEWDEIEDVDSHDEKKASSPGLNSDRADVKKRLSAAEDDEDLSWDIEEDDDEPVKS